MRLPYLSLAVLCACCAGVRAETIKFIARYPAPYANYSFIKTPSLELTDKLGNSVLSFASGSLISSKPLNFSGGDIVLSGKDISVSGADVNVSATGVAALSPANSLTVNPSGSAMINGTSSVSITPGTGALSVPSAVRAGMVYNSKGVIVRQCPGGTLIPDGATCPSVACTSGSSTNTTYTSKGCTKNIDIKAWLNEKAVTGVNFPGSDFCAFGCGNVGCCSICTANAYYMTISGSTYIYLHFAGASFTVSFLATNPECTSTGYFYDCSGQCTLTSPKTVTTETCAAKTNSSYFTATGGSSSGGSYLACDNKCTAASAPTCTGVAVGRLMNGTAVASTPVTTNKSCTYNACSANGNHSAGACTSAQQAACNAGGACYYECNMTAQCSSGSSLFYTKEGYCSASSAQKVTGAIGPNDTIHCGGYGSSSYYIPSCAKSSGKSICAGGAGAMLACFPVNYAWTTDCGASTDMYYDCSKNCTEMASIACITSK